MVLIPTTEQDRIWNIAHERALDILTNYSEGAGLFQMIREREAKQPARDLTPASETHQMTDTERLARLEKVLGTLISWLCHVSLDPQSTGRLLGMLHDGDVAAILARGEPMPEPQEPNPAK